MEQDSLTRHRPESWFTCSSRHAFQAKQSDWIRRVCHSRKKNRDSVASAPDPAFTAVVFCSKGLSLSVSHVTAAAQCDRTVRGRLAGNEAQQTELVDRRMLIIACRSSGGCCRNSKCLSVRFAIEIPLENLLHASNEMHRDWVDSQSTLRLIHHTKQPSAFANGAPTSSPTI